MKTLLRLTLLLLFSLVFAGMASAASLDRSSLTMKVRTNTISAYTKVHGLETYYGQKIDVKELKNYKPGITLGNVFTNGEVVLKSGESLPATTVEYAHIPIHSNTFQIIRGGRSPEVAKAPHEQN